MKIARKRWIGAAALAATLGGGSPARGGEPAGAAEVPGLVRALASDSVAERTAAMGRLVDLGAADPERILGMLPKESADQEIEGAVAELRRRIPIEAARIQAMKLADDAQLQEWAAFLFDVARGDLRESFAEARARRVTGKIEKGCYDPERVQRKGEAYTRILLLSGLHRHPDAAVRSWTAQMLAHFRRPEAADALLALAEDPIEAVRGLVLAKMGEMQERTARLEPAAWLMPHLLKGLESPKEGTPAFCALAILKGKDRSVIPQVLSLLEKEGAETRIAATRILAGFASKEAIPAIRKLLSDHRTVVDAKGTVILRVSREAILALVQLDGPSVVPTLCDVVSDGNAPDSSRRDAVQQMWQGKRRREMAPLPELERRLKKSEGDPKLAAAYARAILEVMENPGDDAERKLAQAAQEAILRFETGEGKGTGGCEHRFEARGGVSVCAACKVAFDASMKRIECPACLDAAVADKACGKCGAHWGAGRAYPCAGCAKAAVGSRSGGVKLVTCGDCGKVFYEGIERPGWVPYGDDGK